MKIVWDATGEKLYSTGVDHGVLYVRDQSGYRTGEAWNGLTKFQKQSDGGDPNAVYADNIKYLNLMSTEDKKATVGCYTYPDGFDECQGMVVPTGAVGLHVSQQNKKSFGFSCRTLIGNDVDGTAYGYKLHICYNCLASPSDEEYDTVNDNPEAIEFSYEFSTTPVDLSGVNPNLKPCAMFEVKSTDFNETNRSRLEALEAVLYGDATHDPRLPEPAEIYEILSGGGSTIRTLSITQAANTTVVVKKVNGGDRVLSNGAELYDGDLLQITVTGGTVTVNGDSFESGQVFVVNGANVAVASTASA